MCQAYESERSFMKFCEENGYAYKCPKCFRWSHMIPDKCSWCDVFKVKPATSQEGQHG